MVRSEAKSGSHPAGDPPGETVRVSLTMPIEVRAQLDDVASKLRINRSALVVALLGESLPKISYVVDEVDPKQLPTSDVLRRMRGRAIETIQREISAITQADPDDIKKFIDDQLRIELGFEDD